MSVLGDEPPKLIDAELNLLSSLELKSPEEMTDEERVILKSLRIRKQNREAYEKIMEIKDSLVVENEKDNSFNLKSE